MAWESGAVERLHEFPSPDMLLRTLLLHAARGYSLRADHTLWEARRASQGLPFPPGTGRPLTTKGTALSVCEPMLDG
jgi:hypothetical protein